MIRFIFSQKQIDVKNGNLSSFLKSASTIFIVDTCQCTVLIMREKKIVTLSICGEKFENVRNISVQRKFTVKSF